MRTGLCVVLAAGLVTACSSGDDDAPADEGEGASGSGDGAGAGSEAGGGTAIELDRPDGPAATLAELTGGNGTFLATAGGGPALADVGYAEAEYTASGTATSYTSAGELPPDGTYALEPGEEADYVTRIVVRRPTDPAAFNGTVVVEWFNVSGGLDAAPDYTYMADEVLRGGYAWVGVSTQRIGIEGGEIAVQVPQAESAGAGRGLREIDPERYGGLTHPGDAFSYDIYTQVARALRAPADGGPLDGLDVERVLAVGESQSAFALTTYVNGVQPLARQYDGFLVHSRGGASAPLGEPGAGIDIAGSIGGAPTIVREDTEVPVMIVQTEGDVVGLLGYLPARQDDSEHVRLWEVAGAAHADRFQVGEMESSLGCAGPINRGQQVYVLRAALRGLDTWVRDGTAPPGAERLAVDESGAEPAFVLDDLGIVTGGVRTPAVDVPVDVLSGAPAPDSSIVCLLMGSTTPIDEARLGELYASPDEYSAAYEQATDDMIAAGFALEDDRDQILAEAQPDRVPTAQP